MLTGIKKNKYNAQKVTIDGITFDSRKEGQRYSHLKLLQAGGAIKNLELQPKYRFEHEGVEITSYKPDFKYFDIKLNKEIVEDVKSTATRTRDYRIRLRCMKAWYGIDVIEV